MVGKSAQEISVRRKEQAVTMTNGQGVQINEEVVNIDPQLVSQRLLTVREQFEDIEALFKYELCSYPATLIDTSILPGVANKAELANAI